MDIGKAAGWAVVIGPIALFGYMFLVDQRIRKFKRRDSQLYNELAGGEIVDIHEGDISPLRSYALDFPNSREERERD